ncbi:hypothetical protein CHS0354_036484 [Potamilus streckersoni]|uniref:ASCH domain-containing protein n=1 Tax=Potamilus streckersoni TaxID=2493646 RepID=A0AAE0S3F8_9BIVA|nr:hypothetical protein CHS0354_036484 [Potamilus streckersoni]
MAEKIETWMCAELAKLGIDASDENASYILRIETAEDLKEYLLELLDGSDPRTQKFITDLLFRVGQYKKSTEDESYCPGNDKTETNLYSGNTKDSHQKTNMINGFVNSSATEDRKHVPAQNYEENLKEHGGSKKKQKFVPLYSQEGQAKTVVHLPGRHSCECQASKHKLINNCLQCGRVVCEQEGSGPCHFCGKLVCTREEQDILSRGSKKSEKLWQFLMKDASSMNYLKKTSAEAQDFIPTTDNKTKNSLEKAIQHKDKLLEYDQTSARRTQVIDDESDYFSTDSKWLSDSERAALKKREEELRAQRFASRKDRKVTLDFAGRRVVEEDGSFDMYNANDDVVQQIQYGARPKTTKSIPDKTEHLNLVNPNILQPAPKFIPQEKMHSTNLRGQEPSVGPEIKRSGMRIQDRELQEMSDEGMCLSMHQPWALLLIKGIKIHEGRNWYTAHRGRLWIAATAKSPSPQEIADVEQSYRYLLKDPKIELPSSYPVGCLLGCVEMVDCLAQDLYRQQYPDGESASPFVFICENPKELVVKFPIKGKHKIYKLDLHIHQAAKKGLR